MKKNSKIIGFFLVVIVSMLIVFKTVATKKSLAIYELESEIEELKDESLKEIKQIEKEYQFKIDSIKSLKEEVNQKEDSIIYVYEKQIKYIDSSSIDDNIKLFTKYLSKADSIE